MKILLIVSSWFFVATFAQDTRPTPEPPTVSCDGVADFDLLPSPVSCSEYYECIEEVAYRVQCPRGYYFSPTELRCAPPSEANCVITPPTMPTRPTPPGPTVSCESVDDFTLLPSPVSCSEYYECIEEVAYRVQCPRGYYFSPTELRCAPPSEANCVITTPTLPTTPSMPTRPTPPGPTVSCLNVDDFTLLPSPVSCSEYYECIDDVAYRLQCPRGYYFSPTELRCAPPSEANCVITPPTLPTTPTTSPGPGVSCEGVDDFVFLPSPFVCSEYYQCINEVAFRLTCPRGYYFSIDVNTCRPSSEANCFITPPPTPPTPPTSSCEGRDDFELIPSTTSCTEYYQCINEVPIRVACPRGYYFSPSLLTCVPPSEANCVLAPPITPTMPTPPTSPDPSVSCEGLADFFLLPSHVLCSEYYQCINEVAFRLTCPRGYYFSIDTNSCRYSREASCVITPPPTPPTPPTLSCEGRGDFDFIPSTNACTEYYQCINEVPVRMACPRGYYFSYDISQCLPSREAICILYPSAVTAAMKSPMTFPFIKTDEPTISCNGVDNFRFIPSPVSCVNYYQCIDGNAYLLSCPRELHFSEVRQTCDRPENVNCAVTEPPPPPPTRPPPPSCEGVENFRFIPSPFACNEYFQCIDEVAFLLECPRGLYFNERIQTCEDSRNVDCVTTPPGTTTSTTRAPPADASCEGVPDFQFIPHPTSCALYYQCVNEVAFLSFCPVGRYFDEATQNCVDSELADCGDRTRRPTTTTATTQAPIIDPQCVGIDEGRFVSNPRSCSSYYQCLNGRAFPRFCDDGLWFTEELQRCDQPELSDCTAYDTTTIVIPTAPNVNPCVGEPDEVYVGSPTYCERFYFCFNGQAIASNTCPAGFWFDRNFRECRPQDEVDCSLQTLPTTTEITTTTDNTPEGLCRQAANATFVRNMMACGEFFQCIEGEPIARSCEEGFWFDYLQQRCTPAVQTWCELDEIVCDGVDNDVAIRAPSSCSEFIVCYNGRPFPGRCRAGFFFNVNTQGCEPTENVECEIVVTTREPRGPCDLQRDYWLVGSEENCSEYFVCYNNDILFSLECPENQFFDAATQVCGEEFECLL